MEHLIVDGAPAPAGAFSHGVWIGNFLYTSGMTAVDPSTGRIVGFDVGAQTDQVIKNLAVILGSKSLELTDVVKVTTHLADLERDFSAYDAVYRSHFSAPYPARTTVGSQLFGVLVEIDVVAYGKDLHVSGPDA